MKGADLRRNLAHRVAIVLTLLAGAAALTLVMAGPADAATVRYALVLPDTAMLRAAPHDSAPVQAPLVQGELVELRADKLDFVQVWEPRRERGGYLRAAQVRPLGMAAADAPELLALLRFLRDRPGAEPLGLGVAAAYLRAAPAGTIDAEPFDAIGTLAERLARRANAARPDDAGVVAQREAAAALGVAFVAIDTPLGIHLCYDGEAFRHALALRPTPEQAARAALALSRFDCVAPQATPVAQWQADRDRVALLDAVPVRELPAYLRNRVRVRVAGLRAALAFEESRRAVQLPEGERAAARAAMQADGQRALEALAGVDKAELADDDQAAYAEAAVRVGASRWAAEPVGAIAPALAPAPVKAAAPGQASPTPPPGHAITAAATRSPPAVVTRPGDPGQTCVLLVDATHPADAPLARRCTYGTVWTASARVDASQRLLALAVQPLAAWRELWLFRRDDSGWQVQVLPPSADDPSLGYVEFAGWVPGGRELLAVREVREVRDAARVQRSFEVLSAQTLETLHHADAPTSLSAFQRWPDAQWRRGTVAVR